MLTNVQVAHVRLAVDWLHGLGTAAWRIKSVEIKSQIATLIQIDRDVIPINFWFFNQGHDTLNQYNLIEINHDFSHLTDTNTH